MICEKEKCTGCHACFNACPKGAITMEEDELGFIYPIIDKSKCVECNLCKLVCPVLNNVSFVMPKTCYAMQAKEEEKLGNSTSGGAATIISENFIKDGGIVYGVAFEKGFKIHHIRVDSVKDLAKIRGSKYVHSYVEDCFKLIKKDLTSGKKVLFIGTPCQVAGLKKYLLKEHENLYTIDIVCHGVSSQKLLKEDLLYNIDEKLLMKCDELKFRGKKGYYMQVLQKGKVIYERSKEDSMYYYGFMNSIFSRDNCYKCKYAKIERVSDLTIGDFWGLGKDSIFYDLMDKGVSLLLPVTSKGNFLLESIIDDVNIEPRLIEEAIKGNSQLREPSIRKKRYRKFNKLYEKYGLQKAFNAVTIDKRVKNILKKNKLIMIVIKKIRG